MASQTRSADFFGPPRHLRPAAGDAAVFAAARGVRWSSTPRGPAFKTHPVLRAGRDPSHTRLRLDPVTPPGDYTAVIELADGGQREVTLSVQPQPRLRVLPGELRFTGAPGGAVSAQVLVENRGNVAVDIGDTLVTGVFDDDGIETALASTYRMDSDDLGRIVGNLFARLRDAHGGLLRLRVAEGAGTLAPGERRVLTLQTTLASRLHRGHGYHGVLQIGEHGMAVHIQLEGAAPDTNEGA